MRSIPRIRYLDAAKHSGVNDSGVNEVASGWVFRQQRQRWQPPIIACIVRFRFLTKNSTNSSYLFFLQSIFKSSNRSADSIPCAGRVHYLRRHSVLGIPERHADGMTVEWTTSDNPLQKRQTVKVYFMAPWKDFCRDEVHLLPPAPRDSFVRSCTSLLRTSYPGGYMSAWQGLFGPALTPINPVTLTYNPVGRKYKYEQLDGSRLDG